jgi:hypothetical protein
MWRAGSVSVQYVAAPYKKMLSTNYFMEAIKKAG